MKKIVILISGRGSNLTALIKACSEEAWPAQIVAVISNRPQAAGLDVARAYAIPTVVVDHTLYLQDRTAFETELEQHLDYFSADLIVLAGFMRVLTERFVQRYQGRMLNIHPSLLPSFPGLKTHQQALAAGVKLHGSTVHLVTPELDQGPIVLQGAVPVHSDDDAQTLAERVLQVEHLIYPRAVRWFIEGRLMLQNGRAMLAPPEPQWLFIGDNA